MIEEIVIKSDDEVLLKENFYEGKGGSKASKEGESIVKDDRK